MKFSWSANIPSWIVDRRSLNFVLKCSIIFRFNLLGGKSGVKFTSDLHVTGEVILSMAAARMEPFSAYVTMDIRK